MHQPSKIRLQQPTPSINKLDMASAVLADKDTYESRLSDLQTKILQVQQAYYHQQRRAIIVFEGWDASGKGGAIRRLTERLDPRGFHVYPISAPRADEQGKHYLYRFQKRLPKPGQFAIFDRSWYGRVLVERVEGFASENEWQRAYQEINEFERQLVDDGVRIVKIFIHIDKEEQVKRFCGRMENPMKRWKLSMEDIRNHKHWDDYLEAAEQMFSLTSTHQVPWHLVAGNRKWYSRTKALETIVNVLEKDVDTTPPDLAPDVAEAIADEFGFETPTT